MIWKERKQIPDRDGEYLCKYHDRYFLAEYKESLGGWPRVGIEYWIDMNNIALDILKDVFNGDSWATAGRRHGIKGECARNKGHRLIIKTVGSGIELPFPNDFRILEVHHLREHKDFWLSVINK